LQCELRRPDAICGRGLRGRGRALPVEQQEAPAVRGSAGPDGDMLRTVLHRAEEMLLGLILAAMTLLTFVQVILRYVFNSGLLWGLEATLYLFGWLVLLGISYGVRTHAHIGVDIAVKALPIGPRRIVGILVVAASIGYACLMFYGAWKYTDR